MDKLIANIEKQILLSLAVPKNCLSKEATSTYGESLLKKCYSDYIKREFLLNFMRRHL